MSIDKYGDFRVGRTIRSDRRVNSGLSIELISGNRSIDVNDFQWLKLSANSISNADLPNADSLDLGWNIVIYVPDTSVATINVRTFHISSPVILRNIQKNRAYRFTLVGKPNSAGEWHIDYLEELESLPTVRYVASFNSTTNWSGPTNGYFIIQFLASVHNLGVNPICKIYELSGEEYIEVMTDKVIINSIGNITIRVPSVPNLRFAGQIIII